MESESNNEPLTLAASFRKAFPYVYVLCHVLHLSCSIACCYRDQAIEVLTPYTDNVVVILLILGECFWLYSIVQILRSHRRGSLLFWWSDLAATTTIEFFLMTMYM